MFGGQTVGEINEINEKLIKQTNKWIKGFTR